MADTDTINPALMPQEGISYPIKVDYCPNCTMPFEVKTKMRKIKSKSSYTRIQDQENHQEKFLNIEQ